MEALPSPDVVKEPPKGGDESFVHPDKVEIYRTFVEFESLPDPDKAEMMGIPLIKDGPDKGRYERIPTQGDFARKYGVHQNTLSNWKAKPEFINAVDAKRGNWGEDRLSNVMAALYRRCVRYGFASDVELYLAYYKQWDRKQVIKHITEKFADDDIRAILSVLPKEKQDEFYALLAGIISDAETLRSS